jgi:hypothetical protein
MATAKLAQHLAFAQSKSDLVDEIQIQIGLYQMGSPIRDTSQTNTPTQP